MPALNSLGWACSRGVSSEFKGYKRPRKRMDPTSWFEAPAQRGLPEIMSSGIIVLMWLFEALPARLTLFEDVLRDLLKHQSFAHGVTTCIGSKLRVYVVATPHFKLTCRTPAD